MFIEKLTDNNKFEVGGIYSYAFACNSDSYHTIIVTSISATRKTCTISDFYGNFENLKPKKKKISVYNGVETISAGNYSMAGSWYASERDTGTLREDLDLKFMHETEKAAEFEKMPQMPEPVNPDTVVYTANIRFCDYAGNDIKVLKGVSLTEIVRYSIDNSEQLREILGGGWYIDFDVYKNGEYILDGWTRGNAPADIMAAVQRSYPGEYGKILFTCAAEILPNDVMDDISEIADRPIITMTTNIDPEPPTDPTPTGENANFSEFDNSFNIADVVAVSFGGVKNQAEPTAATVEKREEPQTAARSEGGATSETSENSPIDENLARRSLESYSFSDYKNGSATAEYTQKVLEVRQLAENVKQKVPEELHGELDSLVAKYAAKLAAVTNDINRCNASCPSWFITGAANYPVRKHEKQQARLSNLYKELDNVERIKDRIRGFVNRPIMSGDETAVERLTEKIEKLKSYQEQMKQENAQARKNGTAQPHPTWELSNNRQNLKAAEDRLNDLKKAKETPTSEAKNLKNEFCKVVKNSDIMRFQLIFDGKPSEETRNILKSNGFKWAPSQKAWQRQLTANAERSFKNYVLPKLSELQTVSQ